MKHIRIAFAILVVALIAVAVYAKGQSAPARTSPGPIRIRIPGEMHSQALIHVVQPEYPTGAKVTGTIVLHAVIATDGTVMKVEYVSGPELLTNPAIDAVKQWAYRPTTLNGERVEVDTTISVVFALDKKGNLKPQPKHL